MSSPIAPEAQIFHFFIAEILIKPHNLKDRLKKHHIDRWQNTVRQLGNKEEKFRKLESAIFSVHFEVRIDKSIGNTRSRKVFENVLLFDFKQPNPLKNITKFNPSKEKTI